MLSFAALLARDEDTLRLAVEGADRLLPKAPGAARWIDDARHRMQLLEGHPAVVHHHGVRDPDVDMPATSSGTLWLEGREAVDSGATDVAVDWARAVARPVPHAQAVLSAVDAAATGDEDRWHDALTIALDQDLRLIAVDAIEGIAVAAARDESWIECMRLLGAALALRDQTGYRWRFAFEERAVGAARAAASAALGDDAAAAEAEGRALEWRDAAELARRMRGERKRPRYGWASLTPTEDQVVALVAQGLTNPQIAERLLIERATVKTHLEHIFNKLDVHSRAELAAHATRQRARE